MTPKGQNPEASKMNEDFLRLFKDNLRRIENLLGWELGHQTECCGVSLTQRLVLLELGKKEKTSLVELAQGLGLDASTLSRSINGLVTIGLVRREIDAQDRRYISLTLTEQGREVRDRIERISDAYFRKAFSLIPKSRHQNILESVSLLTAALHKVGRDEPDNYVSKDRTAR
jgi:DNA-binding MarR family transcriptional regulator